jgi:hypothetical protein
LIEVVGSVEQELVLWLELEWQEVVLTELLRQEVADDLAQAFE